MTAEKLFCMCKVRPASCRLKNNLCCSECSYNEECSALHEGQHMSPHPCPRSYNTEEEGCEYAV